MSVRNRIFKKKLLPFTKLLVAGGIFYILYRAVFQQGFETKDWLQELWVAFRQGAAGLIGCAFVLIVVNWGLEAWKWQKLAGKVEKISFKEAYKAVLVGISLGFITPNRIGDYAGRIMELHTHQRLQAFGAIFLGRMGQLFWTLVGGSIGVLYFIFYFTELHVAFKAGLTFSFILLNGIFMLVLLHPQLLVAAVSALPILNKVNKFVAVLKLYTKTEIGFILGLSGFRYLVFILQFGLLLFAFGVQTSWWQMALGVAGTFLLKSIIPPFSAFTDLGMRELAAMYFFSLLQQNKAFVMSASLSLWFLNIALPSMLGLVFVWRIKSKNLFLPAKMKKTSTKQAGVEQVTLYHKQRCL